MESNLNNSPKIKIKEETPEISAFRAEIDKAAVRIGNADKPKRGPGRPPKAEADAKKAAEDAARQAALEEAVPEEALGVILQFPFELAAVGTGFEGFKLSEDETKGLVPSFHVVLKKYAPAVDPETVAVGMFGLGLCSLGLSKYRSYIDWMNRPREEKGKSPSIPASTSRADSPINIPGTPIA